MDNHLARIIHVGFSVGAGLVPAQIFMDNHLVVVSAVPIMMREPKKCQDMKSE